MNPCPDFLDDIPEPDQAYFEQSSGVTVLARDLPIERIPVAELLDRQKADRQAAKATTTKAATPQNQAVYRLDAWEILARASGELTALAANCGIDWQVLSTQLNSSQSEYKDNSIALDKTYRGKVKAWIDLKIARNGQGYPILNFHTVKHGGITETFNGWQWLKDNGYLKSEAAVGEIKTPITKPLSPKPLSPKDEQYQKWQIKTFTETLNLFNALPPLNKTDFDKSYLFKKGFQFEQLPAEFSIKYATDDKGGYLIYPLKNSQHKIVGFQKIYDSKVLDNGERDKSFIFLPSAKNGSFAFISKSKKINKNSIVLLAEGLATALSLYCATGITSFICLDAGNLKNIAKELKNKGFHNLINCADNDIKADSDKNTGLDTAKEIAELFKIPFAYPELNGQGADFNDLHLAKGLQAVKDALNPAIRACSLSAQFDCLLESKDHAVSRVNERFLNIEFKEGVNIIKSTYGTGKTFNLINHIKQNRSDSTLYIAHLITLCNQAAARLAIESYNDHKVLSDKEQLSICVNSLYKLIKNGIISQYDTIILDEIEQLLTRLAQSGKDAIQNKPLIFSALKYLVSNAKCVIALDADISQITLDFLESCRPNEQFNIVINQFNHKKAMFVYQDRADIINLGRVNTSNNEAVLFATNSIQESEYINQQIECEHKRLINSKTGQLRGTKDFLKDINTQCKADLLTTISPSVSTGFSIESGHYLHNLGIFSHRVNTPLDCLQQLERDRVTMDKHVYISDTVTDWQPKRFSAAHDYNCMVIDGYGCLVETDLVYSQLVENVNHRNQRLMSDFKGCFLQIAKDKGYTIIHVENSSLPADKFNDREERRAIKEALRLEYAENVALSEVINPDLSPENATDKPTSEESLGRENFKIQEFYQPIIEENLLKHRADIKAIETLPEAEKQAYSAVLIAADQLLQDIKELENSDLSDSDNEELKKIELQNKAFTAHKVDLLQSDTEELKALAKNPIAAAVDFLLKKQIIVNCVIDDSKTGRRDKAKNLNLGITNFQDVKRDFEISLKNSKSAYFNGHRYNAKFTEDIDYTTVKHLLFSRLFSAIGINQDLTLAKVFYNEADLSEFFEWLDVERDMIAAVWNVPSKEDLQANPYRYVSTLLDMCGLAQERQQKKLDKKVISIGYKIKKDLLLQWASFLNIKPPLAKAA